MPCPPEWIDFEFPRLDSTDSSSDSALHTHSTRRPSAAALLTLSWGRRPYPTPSHTRTLRQTLSPTVWRVERGGVFPICQLSTKIGSQKNRAPKTIPEGGPIPLHRDTTILVGLSFDRSYIVTRGLALAQYCHYQYCMVIAYKRRVGRRAYLAQ